MRLQIYRDHRRLHRSDGASHGVGCSVQQKVLHDRPYGFWHSSCDEPDSGDIPRSAARPLRYMDRYVTITQGEVMYMTEMLAILEGIERGPAGNTALACAFSLAQSLPEDEIVVVTETEYTGAGKHIQPQLSFAREKRDRNQIWRSFRRGCAGSKYHPAG